MYNIELIIAECSYKQLSSLLYSGCTVCLLKKFLRVTICCLYPRQKCVYLHPAYCFGDEGTQKYLCNFYTLGDPQRK